jgi:DNA polymerase-3 subunit gamma/tau
MSLHEDYRPRSWDQLRGQTETRHVIDSLRPRGLTGRAYWISGPTGTGKTTIARLIAAEVSDPCLTTELDATKVTAGWCEQIERELAYKPLFGDAYAWIINEAHRLRADLVTRFLTLLDPVPGHAVYIFTTTTEAQKELWDRKLDAAPFLSRCVRLTTKRDDGLFAYRAYEVARKAGLNGQPMEAYRRLIEKHEGNLRAALQEVENGITIKR